jgi:hypothetical protein
MLLRIKTIIYWRDLKPKFDSDGRPENEAAWAFGMRPAELAREYCGHASVWGSIQSGQPAGGKYSYAIRAINSGHVIFENKYHWCRSSGVRHTVYTQRGDTCRIISKRTIKRAGKGSVFRL